MTIIASGNHDIPSGSALFKGSVPVAHETREEEGRAVPVMAIPSFQGFQILLWQQEMAKKQKKRFRVMMVLATVTACVAFRAGLNSPGGLWRDEEWVRYVAFNCFNAAAFVTSLAMVVLLMVYHGHAKVLALEALMFANLASFLGAFAANAPGYGGFSIVVIFVIYAVWKKMPV